VGGQNKGKKSEYLEFLVTIILQPTGLEKVAYDFDEGKIVTTCTEYVIFESWWADSGKKKEDV